MSFYTPLSNPLGTQVNQITENTVNARLANNAKDANIQSQTFQPTTSNSGFWNWLPSSAKENSTNYFNSVEALKEYFRNIEADSTKYQRAVKDMINAGLNPAMANNDGINTGNVSASSARGVQPSNPEETGLGFLGTIFSTALKVVGAKHTAELSKQVSKELAEKALQEKVENRLQIKELKEQALKYNQEKDAKTFAYKQTRDVIKDELEREKMNHKSYKNTWYNINYQTK